MVRINSEKIAQRQNSECCNSDFRPVRRLQFSFKYIELAVEHRSYYDYIRNVHIPCQAIYVK